MDKGTKYLAESGRRHGTDGGDGVGERHHRGNLRGNLGCWGQGLGGAGGLSAATDPLTPRPVVPRPLRPPPQVEENLRPIRPEKPGPATAPAAHHLHLPTPTHTRALSHEQESQIVHNAMESYQSAGDPHRMNLVEKEMMERVRECVSVCV